MSSYRLLKHNRFVIKMYMRKLSNYQIWTVVSKMTMSPYYLNLKKKSSRDHIWPQSICKIYSVKFWTVKGLNFLFCWSGYVKENFPYFLVFNRICISFFFLTFRFSLNLKTINGLKPLDSGISVMNVVLSGYNLPVGVNNRLG